MKKFMIVALVMGMLSLTAAARTWSTAKIIVGISVFFLVLI